MLTQPPTNNLELLAYPKLMYGLCYHNEPGACLQCIKASSYLRHNDSADKDFADVFAIVTHKEKLS